MENYETAEGVSLPRSTLYNHYMRHCNEHKLDAVNAASFGKLIRSVFTGLRTRRLGTRGNSKYHYYGIRVKPGSGLMVTLDDQPKNSVASTTMTSTQSTTRIRKTGTKPETYEACSQVGDTVLICAKTVQAYGFVLFYSFWAMETVQFRYSLTSKLVNLFQRTFHWKMWTLYGPFIANIARHFWMLF